MRKVVAVLMIVAVFVSGCATSTVIKTVPENAEVYIDGQLKGNSPVTHSDSEPAWSKKTVLLKKPGYKDKTVELKKEKVQVGPIIGGVLLLFPFIWMFGYEDSVSFDLELLN